MGRDFSFLEGIRPMEGRAAALGRFLERGMRGEEGVDEEEGRVPIEGMA